MPVGDVDDRHHREKQEVWNVFNDPLVIEPLFKINLRFFACHWFVCKFFISVFFG